MHIVVGQSWYLTVQHCNLVANRQQFVAVRVVLHAALHKRCQPLVLFADGLDKRNQLVRIEAQMEE